jgi:hypothetical protein
MAGCGKLGIKRSVPAPLEQQRKSGTWRTRRQRLQNQVRWESLCHVKKEAKQVPRNNQERGSLQTPVPMEGRFGDKTPDEEDRDRGTTPVGLASGGTSGGPRKEDDDMDRVGTSDGARVESSGRQDLRGEEDRALGDEAGKRRNEGSQGSEGETKSEGGQTNKKDRSLNSQPDNVNTSDSS